ncbi:Kinase [Giardia lamblia P15]|uniref:non-specific serine/threonine protein kinase n=1 Tax=Giardia intestinalis (strain P15) TaxID=658858 RepID=E1F3P8_GIAIA|nr:Kinase [Giardia lamblia P15]
MNDSFGLFTTNSIRSENSTESENSPTYYHTVLEFAVKPIFYPPLKHGQARDRIWTRVYPDGSVSIHEYKLHSQIGKGSYADVYTAENTILRRTFVLRMVDRIRLAKALGTQEAADKFLWSAASLMDKVQHPNVVRLYEVFFNLLAVPTPYIRHEDVNTSASTQMIHAGVIYSNFGGLFSSSQNLAVDSLHLHVSTSFSRPNKNITYDMVKGILSPTHLGQIFDVNGTSAIRSPDDIDSYNNKFIYVIERCHMKDLNSNLKGLSLRDIVIIFYQIAHGLEYLHSLLIVHHDIKLENVLIDSTDSSSFQSTTSENPHKSSLRYGIDLSNLCNLCSPININNTDTDAIKSLRTWLSPFNPAASELESPSFYNQEPNTTKTITQYEHDIFSSTKYNFAGKNKTRTCKSTNTDFSTNSYSKYWVPPISLGAYDSVETILDTSLTSLKFSKIVPFYIYYSLIFSSQFDSSNRLAFEHVIKRSNINTYPLVAKLSDFDTAKDLSIHGKVLPSLQDLLGKIVHELIEVLIDVFTNNLSSLLTNFDFLDAFLEDFFFSTINYESDSYQSNILHTNYYVSCENLDQLRPKTKVFNGTNELKSFLTNSSKCGHLQETFTLSTSSSSDLSFAKSTFCTDTTERVFVPDQTTSDLALPASMTPNDMEVCSSPISSTTQFIAGLTDENPLLGCSDNENSSDPQLIINVGKCCSHSADGTNTLDTGHQEPSCSALEKSGPVLLSDIQTNTSTYSSPSHILHCTVGLTSNPLTFNSLQRHDTSSKSFARRLPRVHRTINFSCSQVMLSRRSSSTRRLYLHHLIRYLNKLLILNIQPKILQNFYFLLELLNTYFTSNIFEDKLAERLTTLFSSSEFICHHPLSKHTFPAYLSSIAGTRHCMPPESLRVWNTPSAATPNLYMGMPSDVWQFGVALYAVLIGKHRELPLQRSSEEAMQISTHLSLLLADLLCGLLAPSPMQRYTMVEVVNHPFFDANNFPLSASPDQLFTINFSSKYTPSTNSSKEHIDNKSGMYQCTESLHHSSAGASDPGLRSTLFAGVLYPDSLPFSSHVCSSKANSSNNLIDKIQAHIDSKEIRKSLDLALRFLAKNSAHGEELLKMSLRLRKYHFWVTVRRRDKLVRENRRMFRRSSISNDEIYSLLIQTPHNSKQLLLSALQSSKSKDYNVLPRLTNSDKTIMPHKSHSGTLHDERFGTSLEESTNSAQDSDSLVTSGIKKASMLKLYETACSSTSNLPIYKARPRTFLNDDSRHSDWSASKLSGGQFDLMNVAAGDNVLDQLHDDIYLMLNTIPWKSSFVRVMPYISNYDHSMVKSMKRKSSFHSVFNATGTNFTEMNPFIDIEVNIKELSIGANIAFSKLFNLFSLGLLNDMTTVHDSGATTVSTRSLEYIFSNSLLKGAGNIWGLIKALKSIQVGVLLECLVSTVPYFEKLTISRLTWIKHLYSTVKAQHNSNSLSLQRTATNISCTALQYPSTTALLSANDPPVSLPNVSGHDSLYKSTSVRLTTSGISNIFANQYVHEEATASSSTYTTEIQPYSTDPTSPIRKSNNISLPHDESVEVFYALLSSPSSVPSFIENDSETMRCYYSVNTDSCVTPESISSTLNGLATIVEEERQISSKDALLTTDLTSISPSSYSQSLSAKLLTAPVDLTISKVDLHTSTGIFPFDDLCCLSRSKTASECQLEFPPRSASATTFPKVLPSFATSLQAGFKERLQEGLGESITSGYSISECANDILTPLDQLESLYPRMVRYSSAMISRSKIPEYPRSSGILMTQSQQNSNEKLTNDRIMLLHTDTSDSTGIAALHSQIRTIWAGQASKMGPAVGSSSGQLSTKGSTNYPSQKTSSQTLRVDSQEKSDSTRIVSSMQGHKLSLRKHGSTTALAGIFSDMSMQCKNIERMSRFVSMESSSYSDSTDCETLLSTALPGKEKTSESCRDHDLPESNALQLELVNSESLLDVNPSSRINLPGLKNAVKFQKTILNAPAAVNSSFTSRNSSANSLHLYDKANTHLSRSSACIAATHNQPYLEECPSMASASNNSIPSCVLDIFESAIPCEDDVDNVSVAANVTRFLGLDVNNLDNVEIEYSTSTTK